jgi:phosphoribosyl 1,2-cyclic phosphodiesterase
MARHGTTPQTHHIVMSHLHWDHIMGLPFSRRRTSRVTTCIYGGHASLEMALRRQQDARRSRWIFRHSNEHRIVHVEPGKPSTWQACA